MPKHLGGFLMTSAMCECCCTVMSDGPARRGLSTKTLAVFDFERPEDMVPINRDGEFDASMLMKAEDAVESLRSRCVLLAMGIYQSGSG